MFLRSPRLAGLTGVLVVAAACSFDESGPGFQDAGAQFDTALPIDASELDGSADDDASAMDASDLDASEMDAAPDAQPPPDAAVDATPPPDATVDATPPPDTTPPDAGCAGWDLGFITSNFHPCDIPTPDTGWTIDGQHLLLDTTAQTLEEVPAGTEMNLKAHTVVTQATGPDILIVSVDSFTMTNDAILDVRGSRALAIVSFGDITIDNNSWLNANADHARPGPGGEAATSITPDTVCNTGRGGAGILQTWPSSGTTTAGSGAGGGAYGSAGGRGAKVLGASGGDHPVSGGAVNGNQEITPLRGGCPGGSGGNNTPSGGAGGGAIQLVAADTITVGASGAISASGGGGQGTDASNAGGGGAGSGGAILLEAGTLIDIDNVVFAQGGAAGQGTYGGATHYGDDGENGYPLPWSPDAAQGGANSNSYGGHGGNGATQTVAAEDGFVGTNQNGAGGGGGGAGVGRIHFRAPTRAIDGSAFVSPTPYESSP